MLSLAKSLSLGLCWSPNPSSGNAIKTGVCFVFFRYYVPRKLSVQNKII